MVNTPRPRRLARALRHAPDRILHRLRRTAARRRVARARPRRLLVVCLGNICRSPYAAGVLERLLPGREIRSSGFLEANRSAPRLAVSVAAERGVDLTGHASAHITPDVLDWADLVIVMDGRQGARASALASGALHLERLGDFDPRPIDTRTVPDPIERDRAFFEAVYDRIDACCGTIARELDGSADGS